MMWWLLLAACVTVLAAVAVYWLKKFLAAVSEWYDAMFPGGDDYGNC